MKRTNLYRHYEGGRLYVGSAPRIWGMELVGYITYIAGEMVFMPAHNVQQCLLPTWIELARLEQGQ